jgi:hypothetical protein
VTIKWHKPYKDDDVWRIDAHNVTRAHFEEIRAHDVFAGGSLEPDNSYLKIRLKPQAVMEYSVRFDDSGVMLHFSEQEGAGRCLALIDEELAPAVTLGYLWNKAIADALARPTLLGRRDDAAGTDTRWQGGEHFDDYDDNDDGWRGWGAWLA